MRTPAGDIRRIRCSRICCAGSLIDRPNQVWAADVTYIPMERGFVYLVAVIDWFSRKVLSWRVSNSLTADFCVEALEEAIARYGAPEIFNTDQGSQFTAADFIGVLKHTRHPHQHGRSRRVARQRVRRAAVALGEVRRGLSARLRSVSAAKAGIGKYLAFFNTRRPHTSLDRQTPDTVYFKSCRSRRQPKPRGSTYLDRENCLEKRGHLSSQALDAASKTPCAG